MSTAMANQKLARSNKRKFETKLSILYNRHFTKLIMRTRRTIAERVQQHAYRTMKRWSNQVRIHSNSQRNHPRVLTKLHYFKLKTAAFWTNPGIREKEIKQRKITNMRNTDPETSQISHALFSHFCTKSRHHIKEIKTPVLRHRTFNQIHEQKRIRMKQEGKKNRNKLGNKFSAFKWKSQWCVHRKRTRKDYL